MVNGSTADVTTASLFRPHKLCSSVQEFSVGVEGAIAKRVSGGERSPSGVQGRAQGDEFPQKLKQFADIVYRF